MSGSGQRPDEMIGSEGEKCIIRQFGKRYRGVVESVESGGLIARVRIDGSGRLTHVNCGFVELVDSEDQVSA